MTPPANQPTPPELRAIGAPTWVPLLVHPDQLQYQDLLQGDDGPLFDHVVEADHHPILYVRSRPCDDLPALARVVALRGEGAAMAILTPGQLQVYDATLRAPKPVIRPGPSWLPDRIATPPQVQAVHKLMVDLLDEVTTALTACMSHDDALSLAGRALFTRFLLDRRAASPTVILGEEAQDAELFADARAAHRTCTWLDETFNGNLLPLSGGGEWLERLPVEVWAPLTHMLLKAPRGQLQLSLDWPGLDFAHVPVGLLSEVYEAHCSRHDPEQARRDSVHYTPRHIAEYMVRESLGALEHPERARVLDPACGGGVFLVAAYRELVRHRWRADGRRPSRATLHEMLHQQITGFDVQPAALRLAALALYLTAIELDADDHSDRRFRDLANTVLHDVSHLPHGSLHPRWCADHRGTFDLVVGNPPWTSRNDVDWTPVNQHIVNLGKEWGVIPPPVRDKRPDLPFLWTALHWARPGGQIAMVVHGRFLYERDGGASHRQALFQAVQVNGILNGSTISRNKRFWPDIETPFALVFARAQAPKEPQYSWFITPLSDKQLNGAGRLRIDFDQEHVVAATQVIEDELTLRLRMRGTRADLELIERLRRQPATLGAWWAHLGLSDAHQGYRKGGASAARTKSFAEFAEGWPHLTAAWRHAQRFLILQPDQLPPWEAIPLELPRSEEIFQPPLVLMPKAIPHDRQRGRAAHSGHRVYYSESFYGWSCQKATDPELTAAWLHVLFNTDLPRYWALMTSTQYGVEREVVSIDDMNSIPVPSLDVLSHLDRDQVLGFSRYLREAPGPIDWTEIDAWCCRLYGLRPGDTQVMRDALETLTPEKDLSDELAGTASCQDWWRSVGEQLARATRSVHQPWSLAATQHAEQWSVATFSCGAAEPVDLSSLLAQADDLATGEVLVLRPGLIHVARVRHPRYWTPTRARLFLSRLVRDHGDLLAGAT